MKTILANLKMLLPNRTIACGDLVVKDGRISQICTDASHPCDASDATRLDLSGCLAMPGLINCHGHTPMTLVRGLGCGLPLQKWLFDAIFPVEAKMTPDDIRAGMTWGIMEMLASGTTCVADMYDFPEACAEKIREAGFKANLNRVGLAFPDGSPANRLSECIDFVAREKNDSKISRDFCIHSEYLTNEKFCREMASANRDFKRPLHVHVSETAREHDECLSRHGLTPIAYLAKTGLLDFGAYAAHCVYCTDDDFRIMREKNVTLVHNPTSNMKLGSGFARIVRARELGVNVALGTDGCASNDNLDMFEEMHLAALIHKGLARDASVLSAWDVIEMATVNGARALGRADAGSIAVGACADLCIVDLSQRPHLLPCLDEANLVVYAMKGSDVVLTMVDGEILYDAREGQNFLTINRERAEFDFRLALRRLGLRSV